MVSCRAAEFFVASCMPLLVSMCALAGEAALRAMLQAGAIAELFTSNLKQGTAAGRAAARQLLTLLAQQASTHR